MKLVAGRPAELKAEQQAKETKTAKPKNNKTRISFLVDQDAHKELKRLALEKDTTVTELLNRAIIEMIER